MPLIELDLNKTVEQNASIYFDKSKKMKKKAEGAKEALKIHEKKLKDLEKKKEKEKAQYDEKKKSNVKLKKEWYEKFRWFISSEGFLVIGGRDATTNEIVIKKHTDKNDLVFHTDLAGSPFFVIKTENKKPGKKTLQETADATVTFSRVFKLGQSSSPIFYVKPEQVSKEAQTGEYLTKGAFMIRGKTNYIENKINLAVGKLESGRLMAAPIEAIKKHCKEFIILVQGDKKTSEIAKKIKAKFGGNLDDIIRILSAGGIDLKKS
jgi:predicted ribosome quality control (RQC) complex YloA/Tae2 family protein